MELLYGQKKYIRNDKNHIFMIKHQLLKKSYNSFEFGGDILYGICLTFNELHVIKDYLGQYHSLVTPITFCVLTRYPFFQLHMDFLHTLLSIQQTERLNQLVDNPNNDIHQGKIIDTSFNVNPHQVQGCIELIQKYYAAGVPKRGQRIQIALIGSKDIIFQRPIGIGADIDILLANYCCVLSWSNIKAIDLVQLLECALKEYKIIICSENLALTTSAVLSFIPLLHPLSWTGVILPILPKHLLDFLDSPVPLLTGIQKMPSHIKKPNLLPSRTLVWFPTLPGTTIMGLPLHKEEEEVMELQQQPLLKAQASRRNNSRSKRLSQKLESFFSHEKKIRPKFWMKGNDKYDQHINDTKIVLPNRQILSQQLQPILDKLALTLKDMPDQHSIYYPTEIQLQVIHEILQLIKSHIKPLLLKAVSKRRAIQAGKIETVETHDQTQAFVNYLTNTQMIDSFLNQKI